VVACVLSINLVGDALRDALSHKDTHQDQSRGQ